VTKRKNDTYDLRDTAPYYGYTIRLLVLQGQKSKRLAGGDAYPTLKPALSAASDPSAALGRLARGKAKRRQGPQEHAVRSPLPGQVLRRTVECEIPEGRDSTTETQRSNHKEGSGRTQRERDVVEPLSVSFTQGRRSRRGLSRSIPSGFARHHVSPENHVDSNRVGHRSQGGGRILMKLHR